MEVENKQNKTKRRIVIPRDKLKFPFGKYKGELVREIIKNDPSYCQWLYERDFMPKFEDIYNLFKDELPPKLNSL